MLKALPALNDNYIWLYGRANLPVIVIDIPETAALFTYLAEYQLKPIALLLTHFHDDHTAGVMAFKQKYPNIPIYGPSETEDKGATEIVNQGEIQIGEYKIQVIPTAGHTANHVSYFVDKHLFCGDTLFSAGCGRVFTGDYQAMFNGLQLIKQLPDDTIICPGHEYTLGNLAFAESINPNQSIKTHRKFVESIRNKGLPSVPTYLALEKQINPFLQAETLEQFIQLRQAKNKF